MAQKLLVRSDGPDLVKAFAIALVVLGHTLRGLVKADILAPGGAWGEIDRIIYLFHMPIFFFLSGLFVQHTFARLGPVSFFKRKALVLLGPMVVWSYAQSSLQYLMPGGTNARLSLHDVVTAPFPPQQQFWFLWALFCSSAVAGLFLFARRGRLGVGLLAASLVAVACVGDVWTIGFVSYRKFMLSLLGQPALYFPYFGLGMILPASWLAERKIGTLACVASFTAAVGLFEAMPRLNLVFYPASFVCVLALYKIGLNLAARSPFAEKGRQAFLFVGRNSMLIYLAYIICEAAARSAFLKLGITNADAHLVGGVLVGLFAPLALVPAGAVLAAYAPVLATVLLPVASKKPASTDAAADPTYEKAS